MSRGANEVLEKRIAERLDREDYSGAAEDAIRGYGPGILGALIKMCRSRDLADEAFGEFCEDLWAGIKSFERRSSFRAWSYQIAYHAAIGLLRHPARKRAQRLTTSMVSRLANEVSTSVPSQERRVRAANELRSRLDPGEQMLLTLRVDRGMSWEEVAEVLSSHSEPLNAGAARTRYSRLVARLRAASGSEGR